MIESILVASYVVFGKYEGKFVRSMWSEQFERVDFVATSVSSPSSLLSESLISLGLLKFNMI